MIKFILVLSVLLPSGEIQVDSKVVDSCPEKTLFTAQMENKRIHKEILNWNAMCFRLDVSKMLGEQS